MLEIDGGCPGSVRIFLLGSDGGVFCCHHIASTETFKVLPQRGVPFNGPVVTDLVICDVPDILPWVIVFHSAPNFL